MDLKDSQSDVNRAARGYILPAAFCVGDGYWSKNVIMRLCSQGGGMAYIEREAIMSRKDLNMDNNSILKPDHRLFVLHVLHSVQQRPQSFFVFSIAA